MGIKVKKEKHLITLQEKLKLRQKLKKNSVKAVML